MTQLLNDFLSGSAAWGVLLTLAAFALGTLINKVTGKAIFNPLLLGSIFVIIFLSVCNIPYADYKASAAPVNYLLLPATVALAIPLYEKIDLLKENAAAIIAGISVGTLVSLGSALALALALDLTREQYATLLPKSVTTAISMDVAALLPASWERCWLRRCARCSTSPTPSPRAWASELRPMPWAPAKLCRWARWKVP